ncbi:MAG: hypothetical protein ACRCVT_13195, partial [Leadbetterella sp.]
MYIIDCIRTSIGKKNGTHKSTPPEILFGNTIEALLVRNFIQHRDIQEIIASNAFGTGGNMARIASLHAFPKNTISCLTIDNQCSGGLKSIDLGSSIVEKNKYVLAGGMESCSLAPTKYYHTKDPRYSDKPYRQAEFEPNSSNNLFDGAQNLALKYGISKKESIEWMYLQHQRAKECSSLLESFKLDTNADSCLRAPLALGDWEKYSTPHSIDRTNTAPEADAAACILISAHSTNAKAKILHSLHM